jgi:hypothetical protein
MSPEKRENAEKEVVSWILIARSRVFSFPEKSFLDLSGCIFSIGVGY